MGNHKAPSVPQTVFWEATFSGVQEPDMLGLHTDVVKRFISPKTQWGPGLYALVPRGEK